jgi:hypothetical protein
MPEIIFKTITDPVEAKALWEQFSPHKKIDDEWDFRYVWIEPLAFPLYFIVGYDKDQPVGLLPLQYNDNKGIGQKLFQMDKPFYEIFGGADTDDNRVMLAPGYEEYEQAFLDQLPRPTVLYSLATPYSVDGTTAEHHTDRFETDLTGLTSLEDYINQFSGKTRQNIKSELKIRFRDATIEIKNGSRDDLHLLFELSISRFGKDSSFNMEHRRSIFNKLFDLYPIDYFIVFIDGVVRAVSFNLVFQGTYTAINMGYDYSVPGLGKFVIRTAIPRAIERNCKIYDVGKGNNGGYKERLHLKQIPQYKLVLA